MHLPTAFHFRATLIPEQHRLQPQGASVSAACQNWRFFHPETINSICHKNRDKIYFPETRVSWNPMWCEIMPVSKCVHLWNGSVVWLGVSMIDGLRSIHKGLLHCHQFYKLLVFLLQCSFAYSCIKTVFLNLKMLCLKTLLPST